MRRAPFQVGVPNIDRSDPVMAHAQGRGAPRSKQKGVEVATERNVRVSGQVAVRPTYH